MIIIAHIPDRRVGRRKIKRVIVNFETTLLSVDDAECPTNCVCLQRRGAPSDQESWGDPGGMTA